MEDDKLDLFQMGSLIGVAISNCLLCIFGICQIIVGFFIALAAFSIFFIAWLVFTIVKEVRFRKEVKRWEQRNY
jgi:membrane protein implicated in regulation of membrane protease activity